MLACDMSATNCACPSSDLEQLAQLTRCGDAQFTCTSPWDASRVKGFNMFLVFHLFLHIHQNPPISALADIHPTKIGGNHIIYGGSSHFDKMSDMFRTKQGRDSLPSLVSACPWLQLSAQEFMLIVHSASSVAMVQRCATSIIYNL
jgi:hypothetical protein